MKEKRRVLYMKGVFVCPKCRQSYVQENGSRSSGFVVISATIEEP